ncbi:Uncharacterized protein APZ42_017090 [Daphnia magna]|uniref:Uncharacterized protein n=1 Tax=Daphnia magna TaxID=35525 RepID=A0A0P6AHI9_9CRUS|nr:Uncharacterized protein APZ42_017090 [Daphnia magna]
MFGSGVQQLAETKRISSPCEKNTFCIKIFEGCIRDQSIPINQFETPVMADSGARRYQDAC